MYKELTKHPFVQHVQRYRPELTTAKLATAVDMLLEDLWDAFNQACQVEWDSEKGEGKYDHMCLSTWESIQSTLIEEGLLRRDQCLRP